ncbi:hypothetical protein ACH6EH_14325 [Paenibacillus sp. JSM ZJ436]|uniref:hypothetical protein n=1 Tax=Paenibacillus sp. JSM ZJ436 TaxID=3376190 RepID=UPI0037A9707B
MQCIHPLSLDGCRPYIGQQVCAVLHDGTEWMGTLKSVDHNGIVLEPPGQAHILSHKPGKSGKSNKPVKASAYGYYPYYNPYAGLAWASLAFLFLVPLFFI